MKIAYGKLYIYCLFIIPSQWRFVRAKLPAQSYGDRLSLSICSLRDLQKELPSCLHSKRSSNGEAPIESLDFQPIIEGLVSSVSFTLFLKLLPTYSLLAWWFINSLCLNPSIFKRKCIRQTEDRRNIYDLIQKWACHMVTWYRQNVLKRLLTLFQS